MSTPSTLYGHIYAAFLAARQGKLDEATITSLWEDNYDYSTHTPIHQLLAVIYYLPYDIRKFLLDFARIQSPVSLNNALGSAYIKLSAEYRNIHIPEGLLTKLKACGFKKEKKFLNLEYIISLTDHIYDNPLLCSMLSYFVRAERTAYPDTFVEAGRRVIDKELAATQLPNRDQQLDYTCLFTEDLTPIHKELGLVPERTIYLWKTHITTITHKYSSSYHILFPHYNTRKTVSYPTQTALSTEQFGYPPEEQPSHYTSADLLIHYYRTGSQVGGVLELRTAWFLTDLKPRGYYCLGYVTPGSYQVKY